jgi:hypothetical protein
MRAMSHGAADRTSVLVVSVWSESGEDDVRARITARRDARVREETVEALFGKAAVLAAVERWLDAVAPSRTP